MKKHFVCILCFLVLALFSCTNLDSAVKTKTEKTEEPTKTVYLTLPLLNSLGSEGLQNLRFRFEREFILTLVDDEGNGVRKVDENGNLVLLNEKIIRFPKDKLGKFESTSKVTRTDMSFQAIWEEKNSDPELGVASINFKYSSEENGLKVIVAGEGQIKGKNYITYQKAKYFLPEDFQTNFLVAGESQKGQGKVVSGVKTPKQEGSSNY